MKKHKWLVQGELITLLFPFRRVPGGFSLILRISFSGLLIFTSLFGSLIPDAVLNSLLCFGFWVILPSTTHPLIQFTLTKIGYVVDLKRK